MFLNQWSLSQLPKQLEMWHSVDVCACVCMSVCVCVCVWMFRMWVGVSFVLLFLNILM